jgi:tyrosyl-DNA phosphodiesterase 2
MRSTTLLVLLVLAVLALSVVTNVEAVQRSKLQRQAAQAKAAAAYVQEDAFVEESATDSNEIVSSLKALLLEKKASGEAAQAKLEAAAQHTIAVEAALAEKSKQLKSHNAMLARLEQCLQQGPAESRYSKLEQEAHQQQQSLLEAQSAVSEKDQMLAEQAEELESRQDALESQASELADKEAKLAASEAHLAEQQALLEAQAKEVTQKEASFAVLLEQKVAAGVAEKLAAAKREIEAKAEDKLNAVKQAMAAQAAQMMHEQQTALMEQKASKIAHIHEMRDLTSPTASPYAVQANEAFADDNMQPMLIETSVSHREPIAAAAAPAAPTISSDASPVPAPVNNATLAPWARKLEAHCALYSSCDKCGADGRCSWCGANGGKCLALDVNANLRGGASVDGLTSGQCTSDQWMSSVASRLTLLSLNVFASERGNSTRRFAAIVQLIKKSGADVVALQEVEKWFVHALQAHSWVKNNYHLTEYGPGQAPGGLFILSRYPIAEINYYENIQPGQVEVSARGRVLVAKLGVKQQAVYVATTALDYRSSENRAASLEFIFRTLKPYRHTFLLGDFNFDEGSKLEAGAIPQAYLDVWPTLVTDRPGFTWDPRSNWFAAASDPQSRASRIDRVYLKSNQWMPRSIHLVGCSVSDPLCGAKNLDVTKGVTLIDSNKVNPALILAAPTNVADKVQQQEQAWGTKVSFLEESVEFLKGSPEHAQVLRALADEAAMEEASFVETSVAVNAPKPTFEADFVASNHYGLLVQATQFAPRCPNLEEP